MAQRAGPYHPSPIGPLIHERYGLWHAWRGALVFDARLDIEIAPRGASACSGCATRPCLGACPVDAFESGTLDAMRCRTHLDRPAGAECLEGGCLARRACPVGAAHRYGTEQQRFHQAAFLASRAFIDPTPPGA
jgi:hypothetical protein